MADSSKDFDQNMVRNLVWVEGGLRRAVERRLIVLRICVVSHVGSYIFGQEKKGVSSTAPNRHAEFLSSLDGIFDGLFKIIIFVGSIIVLTYWLHIGFFPKGISLGDTILFVVVFFSFSVIYVIGILFGVLSSFWIFPVLNFSAKFPRGKAAEILNSQRNGTRIGSFRRVFVMLVQKISVYFKKIRSGNPRPKYQDWARDPLIFLQSALVFCILLGIFLISPIKTHEDFWRSAYLFLGFFVAGCFVNLNVVSPAPASKTRAIIFALAGLIPILLGEPRFLIEKAMNTIGIQSKNVTIHLTEENFKILVGISEQFDIPISNCKIRDANSYLVHGVDVLWTGIGETSYIAIKAPGGGSVAKLELKSAGLAMISTNRAVASCPQLKTDTLPDHRPSSPAS